MIVTYDVEGGNFSKAGNAAGGLKKQLKLLNVDPKIIKRIIIALYEAEVNVVAHAFSGKISIDINQQYIMVTVKDKGPGIEDVSQAMQEGYSTASPKVREMGFGAGMGLPNMKKNVDELTIESKVNEGTIVTMKMNLK